MRTWNALIGLAALGTSLVVGCSEANDDTFDSGSPTVDAHAGSGTGAGTSGSGTGVSAPPDAGAVTHLDATSSTNSDSGVLPPPKGDAGASGLVINEVCGKTQDFVELFNAGTTAFDLAGWGVTEAKDTDAGGVGDKPKSPAKFAAGTSLAAGQYAIVWGAPSAEGGTTPTCPFGVLCLDAGWNVSNKSGATVYVQNPAGATALQASYPQNDVGDGQSWGRLPNGTGSFAINTATPGAANVGP